VIKGLINYFNERALSTKVAANGDGLLLCWHL